MTRAMVHVVDPDGATRRTICDLVASPHLEVFGHRSAAEFRDADQPARPTVLITELRLPDASGISLIRQVLARDRCRSVLVVSDVGDPRSVAEVMKLGAVDFIEKPFSPAMMADAIQEAVVRSGECHVQQEQAGRARQWVEELSAREMQVLRLLIRGLSNKQIGQVMQVSEKTISAHRCHIAEKTGVNSIIALAHRLGLAGIELDEPDQAEPTDANFPSLN